MKMPLRFAGIQIFSFFLTGLLLFSCSRGPKPPEAPKALIGEEEMIEALVGIHILEQQINDLRASKEEKLDSFKVYQQRIFDRLSIDSSSYYESYEYYTTPYNIKKMQTIMGAVTDSLSTMRDKVSPNKK